MKKSANGVGLAIIGGGRVGLFRGEVAARHPAVEWIGLAEKNPIGRRGRPQGQRRFRHAKPRRTAQPAGGHRSDYLHRRASACRPDHGGRRAGHSDADREAACHQSCRIRRGLKAIKVASSMPLSATPSASAADGWRRRRKPDRRARRCDDGHLAGVHEPAGAIDNYKRTDDPTTISPMVISGTHALDICMWCLEGKRRSSAMRVRSTRCLGHPTRESTAPPA